MTNSCDHRPLDEVRKDLKVLWYRCPIKSDRLRALSLRSDNQGWKQAGGHLGLFFLLAIGCILFWFQKSWWAFAVALWCLGFVASFFSGTAPHELGHGTVFKTRTLNRLFLYLFSLISWWDPFDYAASHTYHHRYTIHPEGDRENLLPIQPSLNGWLLLQLATLKLTLKPGRNFGKGGLLWTVYLTAKRAGGKHGEYGDYGEIPSQQWLRALHSDQPDSYLQSVKWSRVLLFFHGGLLLIAMLTGWWFLPVIFSLSPFIAGIGSYLLGLTQHCGLQENVNDFRKNTRSIRIHPFLEFLYWHMNWHTEHHMYANVPCYNLGALAKEIEHDMPQPRTLAGAWKEMREIWRRQQQDSNYRYETAVPIPQGSTHAAENDELASSIGDLAPRGLI